MATSEAIDKKLDMKLDDLIKADKRVGVKKNTYSPKKLGQNKRKTGQGILKSASQVARTNAGKAKKK